MFDEIVNDKEHNIFSARAIKTSVQHNFINRVTKYLIDNRKLSNCKINVTRDSI